MGKCKHISGYIEYLLARKILCQPEINVTVRKSNDKPRTVAYTYYYSAATAEWIMLYPFVLHPFVYFRTWLRPLPRK